MKQRLLTVVATALWATSITMNAFAFTVADEEGMFETATIIALIACVPTFYLMAEALLERHMKMVARDHRALLGELCEVVGRADAARGLTRVDKR